jgi:hypothetical protein
MNVSQHRVSLGALALLLCLALPAGLLSLFSETTTGEQVDRADLILAARVASLQDIAEPESTAIEFRVNDVLWGELRSATVQVTVAGGAPVAVGDTVVAFLEQRPAELLGFSVLHKNPRSLGWEIISPVTGMIEQGLSGGGPFDPIQLPLFEAAVALRKGQAPRAGTGAPAGGGARGSQDGSQDEEGALGPDAYEPNDTLATATQLTGLYPPALLTGNPLLLTGLTIFPVDDVDFFSFYAGALTVLHAETQGVTGLPAPDTLMGLFDSPAGNLLAWDDDGGEGSLSRFSVPVEANGTYAVAIESAPDSNLDFAGDEGTTTGSYALSLELEYGSYLWNQLDLILGVSPDGSFIEDFIGFKEIGGTDLLLAGVPADGWALQFDVNNTPLGATHVYGGGGDQLSDPGFTHPLLPLGFELGSWEDAAGFNRRGFAEAQSLVNQAPAGKNPRGVKATFRYTVSVGARTVLGDIELSDVAHGQATDTLFTRVTDVDLFGAGADQFFWSFSASSPLKAFAVDTATHVGNVVPPAVTFGNATGDMQAAVLVEAGDLGVGQTLQVGTAFTLTGGFASATAALNDAVRRLREAGVDTWVVAVDLDPATGLYAAFGTGLGAR